MRAASLCIGIVDYVHPIYGSSIRRLRYAASDATAFSDYLASAFHGPESHELHTRLIDQQASAVGIKHAFLAVANIENLDLFVLYLAGHGEPGSDGKGGWFCLADATPSERSLDGPTLDSLLRPVKASTVLVIADCCHAEALIMGMHSFTVLKLREASLFIASARVEQFAWEDEKLGRSLLSDALLRALASSSPIQSSAGQVEIESALFPYLREQVPLLAAKQKNGRVQEPVVGGIARNGFNLPVVDGRSFGRGLTIAQTVKNRLQQVLVRGAVVSVCLMLISEGMLYHVAADSTGGISIRSGLPISHALMPFNMGRDIDTGFDVGLLNNDAKTHSDIGNSRLWGVAMHLDRNGLRPWFEQLVSRLQPSTQAAARTLTVGSDLTAPAVDSLPPIDQLAFLALLRGKQTQDIAQPSEADADDAVACTTEGGRTFNIGVLDIPEKVYRWDIVWQSLTAKPALVSHKSIIFSLVQNTAHRVIEKGVSREVAISEIGALAFSLKVLAQHLTVSAQETEHLIALLDTPCRAHAALAVAQFGNSHQTVLAELTLLDTIESFRRELTGDAPSVAQETAANALSTMAVERPLQPESLQRLMAVLLKDNEKLSRPSLALGVLERAARLQALPSALVAHLLSIIESDEADYGQYVALELLASNYSFLPPESAKRLRLWLDQNAGVQSRYSQVQRALGFVLSTDKLPLSNDFQLLVAQLPPSTFLPIPKTGFRGEMVISSSGAEAAEALGLIGQQRVLPIEVTDRLARFAMSRAGETGRDSIIDGLAYQWYGSALNIQTLQSRLVDDRMSAQQRDLEVEVACARLATLPQLKKSAAQQSLLTAWNAETEPQSRLALARISGLAQLGRYGGQWACDFPIGDPK